MTLKNTAGKASFHLVKFVVLFIRFFPLKSTYGLCAFIIFVTSGLKWKRKRIALDNLKIVFPEKTDMERKSILRDSLRNMLKNYVEVAYIVNKNFPAERILQMASVSGLEQLDTVIAGQKGALLYSGHFGNFPLMSSGAKGIDLPYEDDLFNTSVDPFSKGRVAGKVVQGFRFCTMQPFHY